MQKTIPHLWYDDQAEEAANFYTSIFKNSRVIATTPYPKAAEAVSGKTAGSVMTVEFELDGERFVALNGGPDFKFNESISFMVTCDDQAEIDYFWGKLTEGGEESVCGWLKDRFGLSWQIVPKVLSDMLKDPNEEKIGKVDDIYVGGDRQPRYLGVKMGFLGAKMTFIPVQLVSDVDLNEKAASRSWFVPTAKNWVNVENENILRNMLAQILTGKLTVKQAALAASDNVASILNAAS